MVSGAAIGEAISTGKACIIHSAADIDQFRDGSILVTESTDPDWVPIMKKAAGLITNYGGTTSHAAIVSRELGLPAIVGTLHATELIHDKQPITLSCAEGEEGTVYDGILDFTTTEVNLADVPATQTAMMVNIASPAAAFRWWRLPAKGIGLARMEFIINNIIKIHPMALVHFDELKDHAARHQIETLDSRLRQPRDLFRRHAGSRHCENRGPALPQSGHRAFERLQEQRIRALDRRRAVRTQRGESDARPARGLPLLQRALQGRICDSNAVRCAWCARKLGSITSSSWCRSAARPRKPTECSRSWPRTACGAAKAGYRST